jgi:hypothetical protein
MEKAEKASWGLATKGEISGLKKKNINQPNYRWCLLLIALLGI